MYTGMRDFDAYARTLRRMTWARELERMTEARAGPQRACVLVGDLADRRASRPLEEGPLQRSVVSEF